MLDSILSLDFEGIIAAITSLIAVIAGIFAGFKNKEAKENKKLADETQDFFNPDNTSVMTPPKNTPESSWKMSDSVKNSILRDHSPEEKALILEQISKAEKAGYVDYTIKFEGGYYEISYGLIADSYKWTQNTTLRNLMTFGGSVREATEAEAAKVRAKTGGTGFVMAYESADKTQVTYVTENGKTLGTKVPEGIAAEVFLSRE